MTNTEDFFRELVMSSLECEGWEVIHEVKENLIIASGKSNILICHVGRVLSNSNKKGIDILNNAKLESPTVLASKARVDKMLKYNEANGNKYVPCLSFGIAKYSMDELELFIIPFEAFLEKAEKGSAYSKTDYGFHYNYSKLEAREKPTEALIRKCWKII